MLECLGIIIAFIASAILAYSAGYQNGWDKGFADGEDFQERFYGGGKQK